MSQSKKMRIEKRRFRRVAIARPMRVRPSGPKDPPFEDTPISVNASKGASISQPAAPHTIPACICC